MKLFLFSVLFFGHLAAAADSPAVEHCDHPLRILGLFPSPVLTVAFRSALRHFAKNHPEIPDLGTYGSAGDLLDWAISGDDPLDTTTVGHLEMLLNAYDGDPRAKKVGKDLVPVVYEWMRANAWLSRNIRNRLKDLEEAARAENQKLIDSPDPPQAKGPSPYLALDSRFEQESDATVFPRFPVSTRLASPVYLDANGNESGALRNVHGIPVTVPFAQIDRGLRRRGWTTGSPIVLVGGGAVDPKFAQTLSALLNSPVYTSSSGVVPREDAGKVRLTVKPGGEWKCYEKDGKVGSQGASPL